MAPAFASPRQAGLFALLVSIALLLPLLIGGGGLASREDIYATNTWGNGSFPFIQDQIFHQKGDIDIVFMGSSHINAAIDPEYVEHQLSAKLGRPATVMSLSWGGPGFDPLYFTAKDLFEHRKVRMLVFYDDHREDDPAAQSWRWVRWGNITSDLVDLPLRLKLAYYYAAIVGMPRNLLDLVKPSLPVNLSVQKKISIAREGFHPPSEWLGPIPATANDAPQPEGIKALPPGTGAQPSDVSIYSDGTKAKFNFSGPEAAPLQIYFSKKLIALAKAHGTKLVCLNIPVVADREKTEIPQGPLWRDAFNSDAALVGIPPSELFAGMSIAMIKGLYSDSVHFNPTGQAYFSRLVTPSLIQLYDQP